ncbi:MAG TPA: hypothetical protein VFV38_21265 [Ktedonobacteraceae bacterium]|nr:hypothetical protein [Ktedonobacteraceae bacterium]
MIHTRHPASAPGASWVYTVLGDQHFQEQTGFFAWWYRHTSLPDPLPGATFAQRNRVRKSRTAAALMLFLALILLLVAVLAYVGPNKQMLSVVSTLYPIIVLCLVLNRKGYVNLVGILLALGVVGGMSFTLLTTAAHGGISPNDKDILYLLFFDELFVAALLPVNMVFVAAALNIVLSLYILQGAPHTAALTAQLTISSFSTLFRVIQIHVMVPLVLWVLEKKSLAAIKRADRAEELARLQHDVAEIAAARAREKERLEQSIAQISWTHTAVANGNMDARVPTTTENVLWQIAGPLNTLLDRYQRLRQEVQQQAHLIHSVEQVMDQSPDLRRKITQALQERRAMPPGSQLHAPSPVHAADQRVLWNTHLERKMV